MVNKSAFNMSSDAEDEEDLYQSETESLHSLAQPLIPEDSEYYKSKKNRKHVLGDSLFSERNKKLAKVCVMLTVALERIAYYSLLGNLVFFTNVQLNYTARESVNVAFAFSGITWISCFIGGILGDAFLGRFKTINTGILFYILGYTSLSFLAHFSEEGSLDTRRPVYVIWSLVTVIVISLGEGCFKSNMSPFGADQLDIASDNVEMRTFFSLYYYAINGGSLIAFGLIAWIQIRYGFCTGYIIPTSLLGVAFLIFFIPRKTNYHVVSPSKTVKLIIKILANSMRSKSRTQSSYEDYNPMRSRLDRAKVKYGGKFLDSDVDDVNILLSLLPTLSFLIIYCSCYYQMYGLFFVQSMHMHLPSMNSNNDGIVPIAWFMLFNVVTVLIFVPIADRLIYPLLDKLSPRSPYLLRMSIGMILATLSMIAAGLVETKRLEAADTFNNITVASDGSNVIVIRIDAKEISVFWQLPQYLILGISEVFVLITGLEFAYCRAPKSMQSFVTSLFYVVNGIGALLASLILTVGNYAGANFIDSSSGGSNLKHPIAKLTGKLQYFFYLMAILNFVNWIGFLIYGVRKSRKIKRRDLERTVAAFIQNSYKDSMRASPQNQT